MKQTVLCMYATTLIPSTIYNPSLPPGEKCGLAFMAGYGTRRLNRVHRSQARFSAGRTAAMMTLQ
jgi:hypothetical protein